MGGRKGGVQENGFKEKREIWNRKWRRLKEENGIGEGKARGHSQKKRKKGEGGKNVREQRRWRSIRRKRREVFGGRCRI